MRNGKWVVLIVCTILVGSLVWMMQGSSTAVVKIPETDRQTHEDAAAVAPQQQIEAPALAKEAGKPMAPVGQALAEETRTEVERKFAEIKGRCIDSKGQPLKGVNVRLNGRGDGRRLTKYVREHGEVAFEDPEVVATDSDGRFSIHFDPPPPYQFFLRLEGEDLISLSGRWREIERGASIDLGELEFEHGVRITGRLVDEAGNPVSSTEERASVRLRKTGDISQYMKGIHATWDTSARISADGTFRLANRVSPGLWTVRLDDLELITKEVTITPQASPITIVVKAPGETLTLSGVVVDSSGQPVTEAIITTQAGNQRTRSTRTKRDGSFILKNRSKESATLEFKLAVLARDCEYHAKDKTYKWGEEGVKIVMRRGLSIEVRVVRADNGAPVENFEARFIPTNRMFTSSSDRAPRGGGKHKDGILEVKGIRRGQIGIFIEPAGATGLATAQRYLELEGERNESIQIRLSAAVTQLIRLRTPDGKPVASTTVELIDPMGADILAESYIKNLTTGGYSTGEVGLLLGKAETDAKGEVKLVGAAAKAHTIRCRGNHPVVVEHGVTISEHPIELIVPVGGTIRVTAAPLSVLSHWRELSGHSATGNVRKGSEGSLPRIYLTRQVSDKQERYPTASVFAPGVPFDDGGQAVLRGAPKGTWDLMLVRAIKFESSSSLKTELIRKGITFGEGEIKEIEWNLKPFEPGSLNASILVDGKPPTGRLVLRRMLDSTKQSRDRRRVKVSAGNRVKARLQGGLWHGTIALLTSTQEWLFLPLSPTFTIVAGQNTEVTLQAFVATRKVRVLDPSGKPATGVTLHLSTGMIAPTDLLLGPSKATGELELKGPPGIYTVRVRTRSLSSALAFATWRNEQLRANSNDWKMVDTAAKALYLDLPSITLESGAGTGPHIIQLPKEWDR